MFYESLNKIDSFTEYLNKELEKLIRALEIYIVEFVAKVNVLHKNSDIEKIKPGYVLSFNYSDTYERIYGNGKQIEYDYIHGKADINKNILTSNLVLGIDEYLDDSLKDKEVEFLTFKKFYQRIFKQSIMKVTEWCSKIKQQDETAKYSRKFCNSESHATIANSSFMATSIQNVATSNICKYLCNKCFRSKVDVIYFAINIFAIR